MEYAVNVLQEKLEEIEHALYSVKKEGKSGFYQHLWFRLKTLRNAISILKKAGNNSKG